MKRYLYKQYKTEENKRKQQENSLIIYLSRTGMRLASRNQLKTTLKAENWKISWASKKSLGLFRGPVFMVYGTINQPLPKLLLQTSFTNTVIDSDTEKIQSRLLGFQYDNILYPTKKFTLLQKLLENSRASEQKQQLALSILKTINPGTFLNKWDLSKQFVKTIDSIERKYKTELTVCVEHKLKPLKRK